MSQDLFRIPVRFDLKKPEHAKIVSFLRNVSKSQDISMSGFIIEALVYYIKIVSKNPGAYKKSRLNEELEIVTRQDLENRIASHEEKMRQYLLDNIIPLISGKNTTELTSEEGGTDDDAPSYPVDIAEDPDIMSSISSWIG